MFYVYLMASRKQGRPYPGVIRDLVRQTYRHKEKPTPGFTSRHDVNRLVRFECHDDVTAAIAREKAMKKWRRARKIDLIEGTNPDWKDRYLQIAG